MAKLTVIRPSEGIHDERKFKVYINGELAVILKQKSSTDIEVPEEPFEMQVISNQGRSSKMTFDPAATKSVELRINKKMHKQYPALLATPVFTVTALILFSSYSFVLKSVSAFVLLATSAWAVYMLFIRREDWIFIVPQEKV